MRRSGRLLPLPLGGSVSTGAGGHGFTIDFSAASGSYAGVTATTTGTVYLRASGVPVLATGGTNPFYEDLGTPEGGGVWVFPPTTNKAPSPVDFRMSAGWSNVAAVSVTANAILGPDGLTMAQLIVDGTAADESMVYKLDAGGATAQYNSCWVLDGAPTPTAAFSILRSPYAGYNASSSAPTWTRVTSYDGPGASATYCGFGVTGGGASHAASLTGVGGRYVWGFQAQPGPTSPPLIVSGTASAGKVLDAATSAKIIDAAGNLDFVISYAPGLEDMSGVAGADLDLGDISLLPDSYLWTAPTTDGALGLRHIKGTGGNARLLSLTVAGVDVATTSGTTLTSLSGAGQATTVRCYWNRTSGVGGMRISVNGCFAPDTTCVASGAALAAPSSVYLGTNAGSATAAFTGRIMKVSRPKSPTQTTEPVEFVLFGDSIVGSFGPKYCPVGSLIYTRSEILSRRGVGSHAISGHTIGNQAAVWTTSAWRTLGGISAFVIQCGINDVATGSSSAAVIAALQSFVNALRVDQPTAKIILCQMLPASTYLTVNVSPAAQVVWAAVNLAIANGTITGTDLILLTGDVGSALNDGTNNIPVGLRVSDLLHTNNPGRAVNAGIIRAGLVSLGVL